MIGSKDIKTKELLAKAIYTREVRKKKNPLNYFNPIDHPQLQQKSFLESKKKNEALFGGNRASKTLSGAVKVITACLDNPGFDCWGATWADLSIPIQQTEYNKWLPKDGSIKYARFTEQRGFANKIILFKNGSKIRFKTYDQGRESFQGAAKDMIHLDEEPPQDIVNECKARLMDRNGVLLRTLTPLNGITYTYDEIISNENNDPEVAYWYFDSRYNPYIDQSAQQRIIGSYADKEAEVRQTGHFLNLTSGMAYYPFSEENITDTFRYMDYRPLEISCDFNVDLMCWNIGQELQGVDYEFDYVELEGQANTDLMCQMLKSKEYEISPNKYTTHSGGYIFYVDIAGSHRHPEASKTNVAIIQENFPNAEIYYQKINNIKDRIDAVNARLKNSKGEIRSKIHSRCKRLVKDLRQVTWEHLLNKNKAGKLTHASDGLSYKMMWKYPLTGKTKGYQW